MDSKWLKVGITALCTVATVILAVCSAFYPAFAMILGLCMSVFASYLYIRCGAVCLAINATISCVAVLALAGGQLDALMLVAIGIVPGLVSGIMQKRKFNYYESLGGISLAFGATIMAVLYIATKGIQGGIGGLFEQTAENMKSVAKQLLDASGSTEIKAEDINVVIEEIMILVKRTMPSMVIIFSMIFGYIHMALVKFFTRKIPDIRLNYVRFDSHKAPKHMSYIYFAIAIISMFSTAEGMFGVVVGNSLSVFDFILAFCGLSFIESKFKTKLKYGFVRVIIYVLALAVTSGIAAQILSIVGMLDSFMDYRGLKRIGE